MWWKAIQLLSVLFAIAVADSALEKHCTSNSGSFLRGRCFHAESFAKWSSFLAATREGDRWTSDRALQLLLMEEMCRRGYSSDAFRSELAEIDMTVLNALRETKKIWDGDVYAVKMPGDASCFVDFFFGKRGEFVGFLCAVTERTPATPKTTTTTKAPTTTTTTKAPTTTTESIELLQAKIASEMVRPLMRAYFPAAVRHRYGHSTEAFSEFLRNGYMREDDVGRVLPYGTYQRNKKFVDRVCPDLVAFNDWAVPKAFLEASRFHHNQFFAPVNGTAVWPRTDSRAPHEDNGVSFLAATAEGYCGATQPMFRVDGIPFIDDAFYTTSQQEYDHTREQNTFYRHGAHHGIQFYIWP